ncbi:MAG: hypothetical protein RL346_1856 [Verrucomicrobiota bacterium]
MRVMLPGLAGAGGLAGATATAGLATCGWMGLRAGIGLGGEVSQAGVSRQAVAKIGRTITVWVLDLMWNGNGRGGSGFRSILMLHVQSGSADDRDVSEQVILTDDELVELHELEHREECDDDLGLGRGRLEQGIERERLAGFEMIQKEFDLVRDGEAVIDDIPEVVRFLEALQNVLESADEIENRDFRQCRRFFRRFVAGIRLMGKPALLIDFPERQKASGILEFLVFDQLANQFPARIVVFHILLWRLLVAGKQGPGFDIHQIGGHHDEFRRKVDIQQLEGIDVIEILPGDLFNGNAVDVQLVFFDEVEQQVEGTFEDLELDFVIGIFQGDERRVGGLLNFKAGKIGAGRFGSRKSMNGNFDSEQWQNFNEKLSHWISKQGFWFQLRHSLPRGGRSVNFGFHLANLSLRVFLFTLVALLVWVWMVKMAGDQKFNTHLTGALQERFRADEIEIRGVNRDPGKFSIMRVALFSEERSFFRAIEMSNLVCKRDYFVDFGKRWSPGIIEISRVNMSIRAGTDSEKASKEIGDVLFQSFGDFKVDAIHVADMSLRWGFTERTRGSIQGSKMKALPTADGWRLSFRGGYFTQCWLRDLYIDELDAVITRDGIRFEKAVFSRGGGSMVLNDFNLVSGQRPQVTAKMRLRKMEITPMLPVVTRSYVEGRISGDFEVTGSTNSSDGIEFDGLVTLEDGDAIILRDTIPLLKALSVVDAFSMYRRVDFVTGSFRLESISEGLSISNIRLFADDVMGLTGKMIVRKPREDEELVLADDAEVLRAIRKGEEWSDETDKTLTDNRDLTGVDNAEQNLVSEDSLFNKLAILREARRMREEESELLSISFRYEGEMQASLMASVFNRAPKLAEEYAKTANSGRISIRVPIGGLLYQLTQNLAKEIYEKGGK